MGGAFHLATICVELDLVDSGQIGWADKQCLKQAKNIHMSSQGKNIT